MNAPDPWHPAAAGLAPPPMDRRLLIERATTQVLAESTTLDEAAPRIIRAICEALGWACGSCWTVGADGNSMTCSGAWSQPWPELDDFLRATLALRVSRHPGGLIRRSWLSGQSVWARDVSTDATFHRAGPARRAGLHSAFAFPLRTGDRVTGVLEFFSREILHPDAELLDSTGYIGSQIGQFSQRTQAQEQLLGAQEDFRAAFDHAGAGIAMLEMDGRWTRVNQALCRMLGYGEAELLAMHPLDLVPEEDHAAMRRLLQPAGLIEQVPREQRCRHREGRAIWTTVSINPVRGPDGRPRNLIAVIQDITERRRAQQLLALEHTTTRALAEADDAAAAVQAVMRAICSSESWACGEYWSLDVDAAVLRFSSFWSTLSPDFDRMFRRAHQFEFGPGMGLAGRVWQSGRPLWIPDVKLDSRMLRRELAAQAQVRGAFLFPVMAGNQTEGVFAFWSQAIRAPDPPLLEAISSIGSQVGQFLRRRQAEAALRESEQRFHDHTIELASIGVAHIAPDGRLIHASRWLCRLLGYERDELLGLAMSELSHPDDRAATDLQRVELHAGRVPSFQIEQRLRRKDGHHIWVCLINSLKRSPAGAPLFEISLVQDISARKQADERIQYLATHDGLTGLPNRVMFSQLLGHAVEGALRYQRTLAVLFIDLDRFKIINDTLGHPAGDQMLRIVAERLQESLRGSDVVARLGGDEFVVLLPEAPAAPAIGMVAQSLLSALIKPMTISGRECRVTASIGIAMFPSDAQDDQTLMTNADIAMYLAKEEGKNNYQFYSRNTRSATLERMQLETPLRNAMDRNEFSLHYQPKVDLRTGRVVGVEALLRWQHPELGAVSPAQFIPLAEEIGLIVPLGRWVLRTACTQAAAWRRQGLPELRMAVNLSPRQFADSELLDDIATVLHDTGMPAHLVELEITEGMVMQDTDRTIRSLHAIKQMGLRVAIDDFGTGYSSLAQLKRFPLDTLKVDRSFVRDLPDNAEDKAIAEAIIAMGRTLSLTVVAEGVETQAQMDFLRAQGCDEMQGYLFSKPLVPERLAELVQGVVPA